MKAVDEVEDQRDEDERDDCEEVGIHPASGVLDDDAFEHVGDVLAPIGGGFEEIEDLFPLDDRDGILLFLEQRRTAF